MEENQALAYPEFIVGIGASAGGLEALERFFSQVSPHSGAAYIVIQHLSPDFKSMMAEILGRKTLLPIHSAKNGMPLEPNHIYLNTPRHDLQLENGKIKLTPVSLSGHKPPLPINIFFESLAKDKGAKSIAVVLSGTGTDGSLGAVAVNAAGGLVIAQDLESALFGSMPQNAAAQGPADLVLPPDEMPNAIVDFIESDIRIASGELSLPDFDRMTGESAFSYLLSMLQREYGIDYTLYKPQTIVRRVERRIALNHHPNLTSYIQILQNDKDEMEALYRDLMVDVTNFFRDTEAFEHLEAEVIPNIIEQKSEDESIRLWIAGCASGEEAYSLTILFVEAMQAANKKMPIKVFATDAHRSSIIRAGAGIYSEDRLQDFPVHLRTKYFLPVGEGKFQIRPEIRRLIVFAPHNLLVDTHFTNLDFISCRNVLIYFRSEAQVKVLASFHLGLNLHGILFLGASEHMGSLDQDYQVLNRQWRIYQKIRTRTKIAPRQYASLTMQMPDSANYPRPKLAIPHWERGLLSMVIQSGFVVDEHGQLQQIYGNAEKYIKFRSGRVNLALTNIVIDDLSTPIRNGLYRAQKNMTAVHFESIKINLLGDDYFLKLSVQPFDVDPHESVSKRYYLVQLDESNPLEPEQNRTGEVVSQATAEDLNHMHSLELELAFTRESLQTTIEEVETTNEELQSLNEELIAANEELQSSNEELSAVNEELETVNAEYQSQNVEMLRLHNDLENMLAASRVLIIFLNKELQLREVTPWAKKLFNFLDSDLGRPITHFYLFSNLGVKAFEGLLQRAKGGETVLEGVTTTGEEKLIMQMTAYVDSENNFDGVILYFDYGELNAMMSLDMFDAFTPPAAFYPSLSADVPNMILVHDHQQERLVFTGGALLPQLGIDVLDPPKQLADMLHASDGSDMAFIRQELFALKDGEINRRTHLFKDGEDRPILCQVNEGVYGRDQFGNLGQSIMIVTRMMD